MPSSHSWAMWSKLFSPIIDEKIVRNDHHFVWKVLLFESTQANHLDNDFYHRLLTVNISWLSKKISVSQLIPWINIPTSPSRQTLSIPIHISPKLSFWDSSWSYFACSTSPTSSLLPDAAQEVFSYANKLAGAWRVFCFLFTLFSQKMHVLVINQQLL